MITLDTHAWIWFVSSPDLLSRKAKEAIDEAVKEKGLMVSSISVWEIALLVAKKRLKLTLDVTDWVAKSESLPFLNFIPISNSIAIKAVNLPGSLHPDPADRIVIASALSTGSPLVTKDKKILDYPHVKTIW